jgi:hypothetical protein
MADLKISQLTSATLPLAGTEVLPIVQSSSTKKVATDDLTVKNVRSNATTGILQIAGPAAGTTRVMTTPNANFTAARTDAAQSFTGDQTLSTGNIIQGTAAKGINFTANTPAAGMTSQLLNWYEEGTWTPTDASGAGLTFTSATGRYTRMGNVVFLFGYVQYPTTASGANASIGGLPFTVNASAAATQGGVTYSQVATVRSVGVQSSTTTATVYTLAGGVATNADLSATALYFNSTYFV